MSHRRSRYPMLVVALTLLAAVNAAVAQQVPATESTPPATANAPVDGADRLTQLARELTAVEAPPAAPAPADAGAIVDREQQPLGGAPASREQSARPGGELSPSTGSGVVGTLGALGLVIAVILVGRWAWFRFGGGVVARSTPVVEVLSRTTVAPRNHVLLLRVGGRILVVGDSAAGLRTLSQIDEADEVASLLEAVTAARGTSVSQGFAQLLSHNGSDFEKLGADTEAGDLAEHNVDRARDSLSGLLSRVRTLSQKGGAS